jgi:hypothetical protein
LFLTVMGGADTQQVAGVDSPPSWDLVGPLTIGTNVAMAGQKKTLEMIKRRGAAVAFREFQRHMEELASA